MTTRGPRIFYYCYDHQRPAGGEKHSYQHVDLLNRNGYRAYAYHRASGFRLRWFDNETPVVDGEAFDRLYDPRQDFLVFPEDLGAATLQYPGRRVIFNKNLFHGWKAMGRETARNAHNDPATVAIMAVSDHNAEHLRLCYPTVPVHRVYASIRQDLFRGGGLSEKERRICAIGKNAPHLLAVHHAFRGRAAAGLNAGADWAWTVLHGQSETEVAAILRRSSVFIFTSIDEGLPRMPLEAMACGALLVAYRDGPLAEIAPSYLTAHYGDVAGLTAWLERIVSDGLAAHQANIDEGRRIAARFDQARQASSVCQAWDRILAGQQPAEAEAHPCRAA